MRALLVASATARTESFWDAFDGDADLTGTTVADLFVGGGTILYEAHRLGAATFGADIDPVACAITRFELSADRRPDPMLALPEVVDAAAAQRELYRTVGPDGDDREALHYFWVQHLPCRSCGTDFDAHPNYLIARGDGTDAVLCSSCGTVGIIMAGADHLTCSCGTDTVIANGTLRRGVATCPACGDQETLIGYARRTGLRPTFRLFAVESVTADASRPKMVKTRDRLVHAPTAADFSRYEQARTDLAAVRHELPTRLIPTQGRSDDRLPAYNYTRYTDLFNDRQQLHLARLLRIISTMPTAQHDAYSLAMSNHLLANNMLTRYTATYRQVTPLFTLRAFVHSARPVELNPWMTSMGRGTFPNAVRKVARAISYAKAPTEYTPTGFTTVPNRDTAAAFDVCNTDSAALPHVADSSVNLVLTDPPYLDNIDYSELADFFIPWLAAAGVLEDTGAPPTASLAAKGRGKDHALQFADGLSACFTEGARILAPDGRFVFTFQHRSDRAWDAVGEAIRRANLSVVNVFPLSGDSDASMHRHDGSSTWDAVFVLRHAAAPATEPVGAEQQAKEYAAGWAARVPLRSADVDNLQRAARTALRCGFTPSSFDGPRSGATRK